MINFIVSCEQKTFIKDCHILDGPLMINEVLEWYKKRHRKMMIMKIEYYYVSWEFLDCMMQFIKCGDK